MAKTCVLNKFWPISIQTIMAHFIQSELLWSMTNTDKCWPTSIKDPYWVCHHYLLIPLLRARVNLEHYVRCYLAYFGPRCSIFWYIRHVPLQRNVVQIFFENIQPFLSISQNGIWVCSAWQKHLRKFRKFRQIHWCWTKVLLPLTFLIDII